ncbi:hypothetical protein HID58_008700, partial [Brassica napus]
IPIQSYKTTTVHLLHTNLQVPLSLLQRQGSKEDEDNVLAETVTKNFSYRSIRLRLKEKTCDVVLLIARFINACDAVQIRLASEKFSPIKSPPNPNSINIKLLLAVAAGVLSPVTVGLVSVLSALSQPFASSSRLSSLFVCLSSIGLSFKIN